VSPTVLPGIQQVLDRGVQVVLASRRGQGRVLDTYGDVGRRRDLRRRGVCLGGRAESKNQALVILGMTRSAGNSKVDGRRDVLANFEALRCPISALCRTIVQAEDEFLSRPDCIHRANLDVYHMILQANFPYHVLIDISWDLRRGFGPGNPQHARLGELFPEKRKGAFEFRSLRREELDEVHRCFMLRKQFDTRRQFAKDVSIVGWSVENTDSEAWLDA